MLNETQISEFKRQGYLMLPGLVSETVRGDLLSQLQEWVEESRQHEANYGFDTPNSKARFDLEQGHTSSNPRLRRVANPTDISEIYQRLLFEGDLPEVVSDLIGPNVFFHHCKLNNKFPGAGTRVEYHADHPFDPHTNDDGITVLLFLDDMDEGNGCARLVPGSHRERYTHFHDGKFIGSTDPALFDQFDGRADSLVGKAGDVCLMDIWTLHGGGPNQSQDRDRRMLIADYRAADAFAIMPPAVPSRFYRRIVAGEPTHVARLREGTMEILEPYPDDSFFGLQGQQAAGEGAGEAVQ
ncbi:MAG TPA: restriction endonuclease subunit S [Gammaproteobacteria bacterium]|jgi:ectoine hydroxylase-related dioxygenase (phytanoyl-CoA dioxygenase family)|nr:MAG: phytanoyl-CoA dioxygenase family protein [Proteobacteria bacterium TMED51]HAU40832.1 restriction endonuclease subunit S [Gammaproteobacteria bacterium]|tara:strand:- start:745 stop:1635 length:891 start_codon:yes stop_codon:yes gene_type:complete